MFLSARAAAWSDANTAFGSSFRMPVLTVVPGGIWLAGPMQQTWPAPKTPCQLTLQPPSWLVMESALGPVTTTLPVGDSGKAFFSLRSRVIDSWAAFSVVARPEVTAASAALALTHGTLALLTQG